MIRTKFSRALIMSAPALLTLTFATGTPASAARNPEGIARAVASYTPITNGPTTAVDTDWIAQTAIELATNPLTPIKATTSSGAVTTSRTTYDAYRTSWAGYFLQGTALKSTASGTTQIYTLPASSTPSRVSRSEDVWGMKGSTTPVRINRGDRYLASFVITPSLGDAPMDDSGWCVLAQAHGPVGTPTTPSWIEPEWALGVRNGAWRLVGGDYGRGDNWARLNLLPYRDKQPVSVFLDIVYGPAQTGSVRLWLNGKLVVKESAINTMYADNWDGVRFRTGVYVGEQSGAAPTYARNVAVSDVLLAKI